MDFFGIGISEFLLIAFFCLMFFKPEELPGIVRAVLTHLKKFRTMSSKVKREIGDIYHREIESKYEEIKEELEKDTHEFRSQLSTEYHEIDHQLEKATNNIDLPKEINEIKSEIANIENTEAANQTVDSTKSAST